MWTKEQTKDHLQASKELLAIKDVVFQSLKEGVSEFEISNMIQHEFRKRNMTSTHRPIVAFGKNTSYVHYYPKKNSLKLKKGDLILLDIWARVNKKRAPYSDITWMAYYGNNVPKEIQKAFDTIIDSRDAGIEIAKKMLVKGITPSGRDIENQCNNLIKSRGYEKYIKHKTGHSLGLNSPHGIYARVCMANKKPLYHNLGYTIEPGIYLKDFGIRSEMDFYIDNNKIVISAGLQKKIVIIEALS